MANAHLSSMPVRVGTVARPSIRAARVAKRRRLFLLAVGLLLFTLAVLANYGPLHAYMDAKSRLYRAATGVVELQVTKAELQSELGRLGEADYLESLARQDLSYARPGEELYIVTDAGSGVPSGLDTGGLSPGGAGFLERVLAPLLYGR
jgi:cell division protein FtsB